MKTPEYATCFELIADFTCTSLREWNACSNSINFLLTLLLANLQFSIGNNAAIPKDALYFHKILVYFL